MDPDATLNNILTLLASAMEATTLDDLLDDLLAATNEADDLSEWVGKGGFLPAKFQN